MKPYNVGDIPLDDPAGCSTREDALDLLQLFAKHQDLFALPEDSPMIIDQIFL